MHQIVEIYPEEIAEHTGNRHPQNKKQFSTKPPAPSSHKNPTASRTTAASGRRADARDAIDTHADATIFPLRLSA